MRQWDGPVEATRAFRHEATLGLAGGKAMERTDEGSRAERWSRESGGAPRWRGVWGDGKASPRMAAAKGEAGPQEAHHLCPQWPRNWSVSPSKAEKSNRVTDATEFILISPDAAPVGENRWPASSPHSAPSC
jgi:hypothetical protein